MGIQKGILENPNDLAINIAINFPLCVAFLFAAKGAPRKLFWSVGLVFMSWGVIATYSRSGLLAMAVTVAICLWEFGIRGKRTIVLVSAVLMGVIALGVIIATPHYLIRIESMVRGNIEGSGDRGSLEAREQLLKDSLIDYGEASRCWGLGRATSLATRRPGAWLTTPTRSWEPRLACPVSFSSCC